MDEFQPHRFSKKGSPIEDGDRLKNKYFRQLQEWPEGMKFEDEENIEERCIMSLSPKTNNCSSYIGNSSLTSIQSLWAGV